MTKRLSLSQIADRGTLIYDEEKNVSHLYLDGTDQVSVVYFRAGYGPGDYPTDKEWEARKMIELSWAIKCPNVSIDSKTKLKEGLLKKSNLFLV